MLRQAPLEGSMLLHARRYGIRAIPRKRRNGITPESDDLSTDSGVHFKIPRPAVVALDHRDIREFPGPGTERKGAIPGQRRIVVIASEMAESTGR